jgi:3-oxoacyl-(acyl-carrier-protein) synthase
VKPTLVQLLRGAGAHSDVVIGSANGTFVDAAEAGAVDEVVPNAQLYSPKSAFGEGVAASAMWQVIVAAQILRTGQLPQHRSHSGDQPVTALECNEVTVLSCGLNQQAGITRLRKQSS